MEIITVEELSHRLHVSRATLFVWMNKGILAQGKHYFKQGRVVRFVWGEDLINELLLGSVDPPPQATIAKLPRATKESPLNWDY